MVSEKECHPCEADRDNRLLRPEDDEILSSMRQLNIELRAENGELRAEIERLKAKHDERYCAWLKAEADNERLKAAYEIQMRKTDAAEAENERLQVYAGHQTRYE